MCSVLMQKCMVIIFKVGDDHKIFCAYWSDCTKSSKVPHIPKMCFSKYSTWSNYCNGYCMSANTLAFLFGCLDFGTVLGLAMLI